MCKGLWLEDSEHELEPVAEFLNELQIEVSICSAIGDFIKILKRDKSYNFLIIDSVISHNGCYTDIETSNSRYTGIKLINDICLSKNGIIIDSDIPILLLTNVPEDKYVKNLIETYKNVKYIQKMPSVLRLSSTIRQMVNNYKGKGKK